MLRYSALAALAAGTLSVYACSSSESAQDDGGDSNNTTTSGTGGSGGSAAQGTAGGGALFNTGGNGSGGEGGHCVDVVVESEVEIAPADIIMVIDNSGSMGEEIAGTETNIDVNFAQIMAASQVDYRVIMVTNHGTSSLNVCINPPLSNTTNCAAAPVENPGKFYHYDIDVQSHDSPCTLLDTLYGTAGGGRPVQAGSDPNMIYTNGWISFLRQEAVKVFVAITDDGIVCSCPSSYCTSPALNGESYNDQDQSAQGQQFAIDWDQKLLSMSPAQFGSLADRNYLFYSIVGLNQKAGAPNDAYDYYEDVVVPKCSTASGSGTGYQWLSKGTQALRFPVCNFQSYDAVFQDIAAGVVEGVKVPCDIVITDPMGQEIDFNTVKVNYTPGDATPVQSFTDVGSAAACGLDPNGYWVDTATLTIHLCPETCAKVTDDNDAQVDVVIDCGGIAN